jgi:hypothetical protein
VIEEVRIDCGSDVNSWGMTFYHQRVSVTVSATEPETVACVIINDPSGRQWTVSVCAGGGWPDWEDWWLDVVDLGDCNWWVSEDPDHTVHLGMYHFDFPTAPQGGTYRIRVAYNTSETPVELTTPPAPALEDTIATIDIPPPDSIIADTTPTFRWTNGAPDAQNTLLVREEGHTPWSGWPADDSGAIWSADVGSATQAIYNFDATALRPELEPGRSYFWRVESWFPADDFVTDPRVSIWTSHYANGRFTVNTTWPELPELPGKICYGGPMWGDWADDPDSYSMWLYSTDLANRKWLGPETACPGDWSPDGVKLLYHPNDKGAWIDPGDGSLPYRIPNIDPWGDTRWSPDGTQLVYKELTQDGLSPYEIRIANIDGTNVRAVASSFDSELTTPAWSPDGGWISYTDDADPGGQGVWLVHPDGTDRHALAATEIAGYPGVVPDFISGASWSPDGGSLVVDFVSGFDDWGTSDALWGIGVISRNGGSIRPVFVAPAGYACCAAPHLPIWSPAGTKIVFSSAHHMPLNPDWYSTYTFEPGTEIWVINADGSGDPVRLTYDFSYGWVGSWWAPPTFTDVERGFWAVCAVNACYEAGVVAGYEDGTYKPELPVTRDQMAVYISRALAGGDENVPEFTDTPTFPDVSEASWALDYVEYAVSQNVVGGYEDGTYHPEYQVTRDQMAVYVARALVAPTGEAALADYVPADPRDFPDVASDFWAYTHVEYCVENGVVTGYLDGLYHPEIVVTRDQMAVYVARGFGLVS